MGVKKLWELLEPTGSRVEIETLAGKRVAVDASIWLVQFIKAMRDERTGEVVKNAHLLGFFRRITRLLCNRVRPVFVFDGATPALKRHTVAERRKRRHQADNRLKSVAEKLLINRMRQYAALQKAKGGAAAATAAPSDATEALPPPEAAPGYDDALTEAEAAALAEIVAEEDEGGGDDDEDDDDDFGFELPALGEGEMVDMEALAALPTSMQLEFIQRHREQQTAANRQRFAKASETAPAAFSAAQMDAYIAGGRVKRQLTALVREGAGAPQPDVLRAQRIAGDETHEFVFDKRASRDAGLPAPRRGVHAAVRAPWPEQRFQFSTLHPVLPPPMAGTVAAPSAVPPPPLPASLPGTPAVEAAAAASEVVDDDALPAAPAVQISFELPECVDGDDDEWEDVEPAAPAADAPDRAVPMMAAEEAKSRLAAALAQADAALNRPPPRVAAVAVEEVVVAAPMARSAVFKQSHGFLNGCSFDDWDKGKAGPSAPPPPSNAEEQRELELAIRRSLSDAASAQKPRASSSVVISLLEDDDDAPRPKQKHAAAAPPLSQRPPSPRQLRRASSPIVVDDDAPGAGAAGGGMDDDDQDLRAAIALSLGQAPVAPPPAVAELAVHFQGKTWRLSINEFGALAGNLSSHWPPWLPSPLDLEEKPCTVRCAGQEWEVQTPMEDSLLGILAKARRAAAGAPPQPFRKEARTKATQMMPPPPPPPPRVQQPAPAPSTLPDGTPAWGSQWENVSSAWVPPAAPAARASAPPPGGRAATAEEEAELNALDAEAEAAMAAEFARERAALQAEHKSASRQADTVSPEMYEEVQQMLTLFGIPYIIAPAEAEAQCAWLDEAGLVDGVVTDDSDVFLFGARTVYRHIFDAKKYVEVYSADRVKQRLGLDRTRLALLALLLGSDYTPGVQGVGPVNATEIVSAFPTMEALCRFKAWVDAPESDRVAAEAAKLADGGRRGARAKQASPDKAAGSADEGAAAASPAAAADNAAAAASAAAGSPGGDGGAGPEEEFKRTHRSKRKAWTLSESFPAQNVVNAYMAPSVDRSRQRFEWGRPDTAALRALCHDTLGWSQPELEKVLERVMQEYDIVETQRTMQSFFRPQPAEQQAAKFTSKRLHKAIAGMTGREDPELLLGELERAPAAKKPRKPRAPKPGAAPKAPKAKKAKPLLASDTEPGSDDEYAPAEPRATRAARKAAAAEGGAAGGAEVLDDKDESE